MNKTIRYLLTALSLLCCAEMYGCATAVDDPETNPGKDDSGKPPSSTGGTDTDGRELCTDEECKEEIEFQQTGGCPQWDYVACDVDGKTRKYCDDNPENKTYGYIVKEKCVDACENGKCISFTDNSCDNPYLLKLNGMASGATESGTNYNQSPVCSGSLKPMMGVFKFTAPKQGFYKFSVASDSTKNWGNILATECPPRTPITHNCSFEGTTDEFTKLLNKGDYYLYVSPANIFANHFDATVSVKEIDYNSSPLCGTYSGTIQLVNFTDGTYTDENTTSNATSSVRWDETEGCGSTGNGGNDKAYIFSLPKRSTVKVTLNLKSTSEEAPNKIAVFINKCDNGSRHTVKTCGEGSELATASKTLEAGEYILFVDSDGKDFNYNLKITVSD